MPNDPGAHCYCVAPAPLLLEHARSHRDRSLADHEGGVLAALRTAGPGLLEAAPRCSPCRRALRSGSTCCSPKAIEALLEAVGSAWPCAKASPIHPQIVCSRSTCAVVTMNSLSMGRHSRPSNGPRDVFAGNYQRGEEEPAFTPVDSVAHMASCNVAAGANRIATCRTETATGTWESSVSSRSPR
jgi:hypothetical protein